MDREENSYLLGKASMAAHESPSPRVPESQVSHVPGSHVPGSHVLESHVLESEVLESHVPVSRPYPTFSHSRLTRKDQ